jgi:hypothetical protein
MKTKKIFFILSSIFNATVTLFLFLLISGCSVPQYIGDTDPNETTEGNSEIIVSKSQSKIFYVDSNEVNSNYLIITPGKHDITLGIWGVSRDLEYFKQNGWVYNEKTNQYCKYSYKNSVDSIIGNGTATCINANDIDKYEFSKLSTLQFDFLRGKTYGLMGSRITQINKDLRKNASWRGLAAGSALGLIPGLLITIKTTADADDEYYKLTGKTSGAKYDLSPLFLGPIIGGALGYLIGSLIHYWDY